MVEGARAAVVIDDDPDVRMMLRTALEMLGLVVSEAMTGHGGVDLVRELRPDLITLDLVLPGFGGVEVCRRIRRISDAYLIMITASSDEADRLVGLATGADDYVTKPFSPREVQARVAAMFRRPRSSSAGLEDPAGGPGQNPAESALIAPRLPPPPVALGFGPGEARPVSGPPSGLAPLGPRLPGPDLTDPRLPGLGLPGLGLPASGLSPTGPRVEPASRSGPGLTPEPGVGPAPGDPEAAARPAPGTADPLAGSAIRMVGPAMHDAEHGILRHGQLLVDIEARVAWYAATELPLTKIEFDLLVTMAGNPRRVWRRETLLNIVWGGQWSDYHVVEVHIGNLRRKLADAADDGAQLIKTVRGIGYRMTQVEPVPTSPLPPRSFP